MQGLSNIENRDKGKIKKRLLELRHNLLEESATGAAKKCEQGECHWLVAFQYTKDRAPKARADGRGRAVTIGKCGGPVQIQHVPVDINALLNLK